MRHRKTVWLIVVGAIAASLMGCTGYVKGPGFEAGWGMAKDAQDGASKQAK